ncbi:hypothetical protein FLONG3_2969 [Fusarium longipes]|uniref:Uncharacterized protein n=1 Tax=Fusarium longipes TaxID=694270 RepID=A0A395T2U5_9HYPO|nr:hypothetical protein FLONG3_2969 [Fusarium longipes]
MPCRTSPRLAAAKLRCPKPEKTIQKVIEPRRTSPRLAAAKLRCLKSQRDMQKVIETRHTSTCLKATESRHTEPQKEEVNKATEPEVTETQGTKIKKIIIIHRPKIIINHQPSYPPLPEDLDLHRPLHELTREERNDYYEILKQRRDELKREIRLKRQINALIRRSI